MPASNAICQRSAFVTPEVRLATRQHTTIPLGRALKMSAPYSALFSSEISFGRSGEQHPIRQVVQIVSSARMLEHRIWGCRKNIVKSSSLTYKTYLANVEKALEDSAVPGARFCGAESRWIN
jgi:hypothetical protein